MKKINTYDIFSWFYFVFAFVLLFVYLFKIYIPTTEVTIFSLIIMLAYFQVIFYCWLEQEHLHTRSQLSDIKKKLKEIHKEFYEDIR